MSNADPTTPDIKDAMSTPIFANSISGESPNARLAMKSDIVKPIPPNQATLEICRH